MAYSSDKVEGEIKPKLSAPAAGPRPDEGPMDDSEFKSLVSGLIQSAINYVDEELGPERTKATDYYNGRPMGNEEPGRSQFISTDVRDGVQAVIPAMLRVVFGAERAVEFVPPRSEDVESAAQASDYVHMVFAEDNPGFLHTHGWIKDGLVRKSGVAKWWWDDTTETSTHKAQNVSAMGLQMLAADEEIELTRIEESGKTEDVPPSPENPQGAPGEPLYTVEFTRTVTDGRARWTIIPPEEFLYNREARSLAESTALWHRTRKTRGELIALGIDPKVIDEHGGDDPSAKDSEEVYARNPGEMGSTQDEEAGKANAKHLYCEGFARIDFDGDGVAEIRKVCALGPGHHPVVNDPAAPEDVNFALFVPDPEPHTMTGLSWADRLMDLQQYKSMLMRGLSDSLAMSIFPRVVYKAGEANLADILNNAPGAPIRSTGDPNSTVREFAHSFLGKEAMPVIDLIDTINERRTGQNRGVSSLDADALQSSTPAAVAAAVSASQAQQELLVRVFAETALKPLFRGLLRLLVTHQPRPRMARLRNQWVEVDPRSWNIDMDATVSVALGSGLIEEKIQTLDGISTKQMEIMAQAPQNPIVGWKELRDTLAEMTELRGRKNSAKYWKPVTQDQLDQMAAEAAKQGPPPSPEMMLAQAQIESTKMKVQADIQNKQVEGQRQLALKQAEMAMRWQEVQMEDARDRQRMTLEDDRERDKQASDIQLEIRKMELDHQAEIHTAQLQQDIEFTRATTQAGPSETGSVEGEPRPPRRKRHITIAREGREPLRATVEDEDHEASVG